MTIYFYGADEVPYGCFSNFSDHGFDLDGVWWPTSEHYFQAQKFAGTRPWVRAGSLLGVPSRRGSPVGAPQFLQGRGHLEASA